MNGSRKRRETASLAARLENGLLAALLATLILLATGQLLARNVLGTGWPWIDPLMRLLVLWLGLTGGMIATRESRHITIPFLHDRLPRSMHPSLTIASHIFTAGVSALLAFHGMRFVRMELDAASSAFAGIPIWLTAAIIPLAFAVIMLRSVRHAWNVWQQKN